MGTRLHPHTFTHIHLLTHANNRKIKLHDEVAEQKTNTTNRIDREKWKNVQRNLEI